MRSTHDFHQTDLLLLDTQGLERALIWSAMPRNPRSLCFCCSSRLSIAWLEASSTSSSMFFVTKWMVHCETEMALRDGTWKLCTVPGTWHVLRRSSVPSRALSCLLSSLHAGHGDTEVLVFSISPLEKVSKTLLSLIVLSLVLVSYTTEPGPNALAGMQTWCKTEGKMKPSREKTSTRRHIIYLSVNTAHTCLGMTTWKYSF